jgi:HJR/Mrr/RecB family endonuclease
MIEISREEFDALDIDRINAFPERAWFKSSLLDLAGTVTRDPFDKDWAWALLAKDEDGIYRYIQGDVSLLSQSEAKNKLINAASQIEVNGGFEESFYSNTSALEDTDNSAAQPIITTIDDEIKKYLNKHPEKLYELSPRKFEELIASILKDLGFEVELTPATRDGGRDIIAHIRNAVCSYLTHIECKRYAPDNKVGVGIVREVIGVHHIKGATKSIIVTTSFFSKDAIEEAARMENTLDLRDFNNIKDWLQKY